MKAIDALAIGLTEDALQKQMVAFLYMRLPRAVINHAANEGNRGGKAGLLDGVRRKAMGQRAGYPDLTIHHRGETFCIEVKLPGKYAEPAQRECHADLRMHGVETYICKTLTDVETVVRDHLARVS